VRYRLTATADRDLAALFRTSLRTFGPLQAQRYYNGLMSDLKFIIEFPESARERSELRGKPRFHPYGVHIIVYHIEGDEVVVRRILHSRQDIPHRIGS
jgi:toxin ParE1/3/4